MRRELATDELDAIHFPLTVMLPRVSRPPAAVSLLDNQHVFFPELFSRAELVYRWVVYGWSLRRPRTVIAISGHVKVTLVERMGIEPGRIEVVHLRLDHGLFRPNGEAQRRPRGSLGARAVPREELAPLYRTASALVFPSLYKGFGQPPLEAMASGTPVAASRAGSLPEVCGDAALYFDPTSTEEIAEAILAVLERRDQLIKRGLRRASLFTWDATARRHDEVYRALAA